MERSGEQPARPRRLARILTWVLMCTGVLSVLAITLLSYRLSRMNGTRAPYYVMALCAALVMILMWTESPALTRECFRRLVPMGIFGSAMIATIAITTIRMTNLTIAADGPQLAYSNARSFLLRNSIVPLCWLAAAILGYAARRRRVFPLLVAGISVWVSALAGVLEVAQRAGLSTPLGIWLADWSAQVGSWAPRPGEPPRAVGLDVDPNAFGMIGMVGLIFAFTLNGSPRSRAGVAAGSALVVVLSGSRTVAVATVIALAVSLVPLIADWSALRRRAREFMPVVGAVLLVLVVLGIVSSVSRTHLGPVGRLATSGSALEAGLQGADVQASADEALGGRVALWGMALRAYVAQPAGAFLQPELLIGRSVHNEYLESLLWGGPLLLGALVYLLVWLGLRIRPSEAPSFGLAMCAAFAACMLALNVTWMAAFVGMGSYLIGWAAGQRPAASALLAD